MAQWDIAHNQQTEQLREVARELNIETPHESGRRWEQQQRSKIATKIAGGTLFRRNSDEQIL